MALSRLYAKYNAWKQLAWQMVTKSTFQHGQSADMRAASILSSNKKANKCIPKMANDLFKVFLLCHKVTFGKQMIRSHMAYVLCTLLSHKDAE